MEDSSNDIGFYVQLGLPFCKSVCRLDVHAEIYNGMWVIPIATTPLHSKTLLCTLYAGVHYLIDNKVSSDNAPC